MERRCLKNNVGNLIPSAVVCREHGVAFMRKSKYVDGFFCEQCRLNELRISATA